MLGRALDGLMAVFPAAERGFILVAGPGRQAAAAGASATDGHHPAAGAVAVDPQPGLARRARPS